MYGLLTTLGRGFTKRIGWKRLGIAASLLIIAVAMTTLVRTLRGVDTGVILIALTEIPPGHIALAALCVIGAFCTLTFYDFFALRTIGKKHVPYGIAALSSFTSYTIGHNIGATVFTGGAIRFRIYSDYGLTAIDVAKVCFLSGLTFWLGNTFMLGIGMAWHPSAASAMDQLPPSINRLIALGAIGAAMLVALPEFGREQLLATLVVFRILYFLIPFGTAISIMGMRELWLNVVKPWQERRKLNEDFQTSTVVPHPMKNRQAPQP